MKKRDARIITFSIFKGGTGKTTTAVNSAASLAKRKRKVLLVDLDHQASATRHLGIDPETLSPTLYDVFVRKLPISLVNCATEFGFDLVPGHPLLAAIEMSLEDGDEGMLKEILAGVHTDYVYGCDLEFLH